jgi:hypothetical protein
MVNRLFNSLKQFIPVVFFEQSMPGIRIQQSNPFPAARGWIASSLRSSQ